MKLDDVVVIGGGPGGLYAAILLKSSNPSSRVRVIERNRPDDTYGFGVAFHQTTLRNLAEADPPSRLAIDDILIPWDDVHFRAKGVDRRVGGHGFAGCSRQLLLKVLHRRAQELGVDLEFETIGQPGEFSSADLVIAADGANSATREGMASHFRPVVDTRPIRFAWMGTTKALDAMTFIFAETPSGVFVAHAYPHTRDQGTWIVECDPETFTGAGLDTADERETASFLRSTFAAALEGAPLLTNKSHWRQFPLITCQTWTKDNLVLLGDAKGTVHYSIGSGTKLAMEDAVTLRQALDEADSVGEGLEQFERVRRSELESLQDVGLGSMLWFEHVRLHWGMPPNQFIFGGVTRKGNESFATVLAKAPALAEAATRELAASEMGGRPGRGDRPDPLLLHFWFAGRTLDNRRIEEASHPGWTGEAAGLLYVSAAPSPGAQVPATPCLLVVDYAQVADSADPLADLAARAGDRELRGFLMDATKIDWDSSEEWLPRPGDTWAADAGVLGLMLTAPPRPQTALPLLSAWADAGLSYLHAAGPSRRALLLSDLAKYQLGLTTAVTADDRDQAETALVAGRVDLVSLPRE